MDLFDKTVSIYKVSSEFLTWESLTSRHVCMHRVIFYIPNTLRKLVLRAFSLVFR